MWFWCFHIQIRTLTMTLTTFFFFLSIITPYWGTHIHLHTIFPSGIILCSYCLLSYWFYFQISSRRTQDSVSRHQHSAGTPCFVLCVWPPPEVPRECGKARWLYKYYNTSLCCLLISTLSSKTNIMSYISILKNNSVDLIPSFYF